MKYPVKVCNDCPMFMNDEYTECHHPDKEYVSFRYPFKIWSGDWEKERHPNCPLNQGSITIVAD